MQLGTFGAILSFAIDLEGQAEALYRQTAHLMADADFGQLARGSAKRQKRLLRARQELVSEMILEPIVGLDSDPYVVSPDPAASAEAALDQAAALEQTLARFYRDASAKMPIREVVRLFGRLAKENDRRGEHLRTWARSVGLG